MGDLKEIVRNPDESYEDFFRRAMKKVAEENKSYVILVYQKFVDVTPETSYNYLMGFLDSRL